MKKMAPQITNRRRSTLDGRISGNVLSAARSRPRFPVTPGLPIIGSLRDACSMIVIGTEVVENYLANHAGIRGPKRHNRNTKHGSTLWAAPNGATSMK
jgi:hypothetical protein